MTKKLGEVNFGSRGASISLELELESALVSEPAKLREKITQAFNLVRASLDEELYNAKASTKNNWFFRGSSGPARLRNGGCPPTC